ncbi:hypothetical protein [Hydrocarboniphaga sp.]|uniref:hypothetical protein n=1 Tax=Hydrocarboniphaga sp. TaxID=2033016 RepID=UPI003D13592F
MQLEARTASALKVVSPMSRTEQLEADLALMKDYLQMCFRKEDWHGVMDASADIREIVAKLSVLREMPAKPLNS